MADKNFLVGDNQTLHKYKDMGDGTHAPVVSAVAEVLPLPVNASKDSSQYLNLAAAQVVAVGSASAQSSAVGATTNRVVISTTTDCWIAVGSNPTAAKATAGSFFLAAGSQTYPIAVTASSTKIAVIQDSAAGYVSIVESM